jgi:hypothetical protein
LLKHNSSKSYQHKLSGSKSYQQQPAYSSIYIQDSIYSSFLNRIVQNAKLHNQEQNAKLYSMVKLTAVLLKHVLLQSIHARLDADGL